MLSRRLVKCRASSADRRLGIDSSHPLLLPIYIEEISLKCFVYRIHNTLQNIHILKSISLLGQGLFPLTEKGLKVNAVASLLQVGV